MEAEKSLQYLLDRLEIEDRVKLYAELIDRKRFDELESVFTPDAYIDYIASGGVAGSLDEIREYLRRSMGPLRTQHLMSNVQCDIAPDGRSAKTTVMLFNPLSYDTRQGARTFFIGLWYHDEWIKTDEGWSVMNWAEIGG